MRLTLEWLSAAVLALGIAVSASAEDIYVAIQLDHETNVTAVAFSPDGAHIATGGGDGVARIWEIAAASEPTALKGHEGPTTSIAYSPDGTRILTASSDGTARLWDVSRASEAIVLKHGKAVSAAGFSPDASRVVTAGEDGVARIWDTASGNEIATLGTAGGALFDAAFSPDGMRIVTAGQDDIALIWDVATSKVVVTLPHEMTVYSAAFSPDGKRVVTGSYDELGRIFDAQTGALLVTLTGHTGTVFDAGFSPDGARVLTASSDRDARIWDAVSGRTLVTLTGHIYQVNDAAFDAKGERVVTGGEDFRARIWSRPAAVAMPAGADGLWYQDFTAPEPMPDDIARQMCRDTPAIVHPEGLVVFFGEGGELPEAVQHMRCDAALMCGIYGGPPAQGLAAQAQAQLSFEGDKGKVCVSGECTPIARCPTLEWTEEQRASGFATAWEQQVIGVPK